jgi:beta-glucosidase
MSKRAIKLLTIVLLTVVSLNGITQTHADTPIYKDPSKPIADRVNDLMSQMTLDEKIGQMTLIEKGSLKGDDVTTLLLGGVLSGGGGYPSKNTAADWAAMVDGFQQQALKTRLGIPMIYGVDAVHGHNNLAGTVIFPQEVGLGAAGDPDLVQRIGSATADVMIATGIYWDYAPIVAVPQDIRWGRTYESYSENTDLVSKLASAMVLGLQGKDLGGKGSVLATPKHFVGDGGTKWGTSTTNDYKLDQGVTDIDEATLRAIHLPPYIAAIKAGAQSIMVSYSNWGGLKMSAQQYLITDVLKGELGFSGFIVSDWQALDAIKAPSYELQVKQGINAGLDMIMVPYDARKFISALKLEVYNGDIPLSRIDDAVKRILTVKFKMGLFEHPTSDPARLADVGSPDQRALGREAVAKSMVLLQNNGGALPLAKDVASVYVSGAAADNIGIQTGGWTIEWQGKPGDITPGTTLLKAIESTVSSSTKVTYKGDGTFDGTADVGIAVVGEYPYAEGKGDKADLSLSSIDLNVINNLRAHAKKLVVILISGRPMIIGGALNQSDAFVAAWLPGTEGQGVADVLFGDKPFTGKLPYTWPRSMDQLPFDFKNLPTSGCKAPLFPFGYGLDTSSKTTVKDDCFVGSSANAPAATAAATMAPTAAANAAIANAPITDTNIPKKDALAPTEVQGKAVYIPFPVKIALDGKLDDWAGVPMTKVDRGPYISTADGESGYFNFALAADDTNLYILMLRPDKKIITGQHGGDYWNEDSLEFYINTSSDLNAKNYGDGIYQINIKPLDIGKPAGTPTLTGVNADKANVKAIVFKTADGYGFEASVPLPKAPEHGFVIGFQAQANGATSLDRDTKLIWSLADKADNSYQDPSLFGQGIFFKVGSTDIPKIK